MRAPTRLPAGVPAPVGRSGAVLVASAVALTAVVACSREAQVPAASDNRAATGSVSALYFANWEGEIGRTTHAQFARRTGIRVVPDEIVDNVTLQTRLLTGHSGIDVAVPSSNFLEPLIAAGALRPLDVSKLPNWRNLDPAILTALQPIDPGNRHGVPYVWGTHAFGYNVRQVTEALGGEPEPSWKLIFDPAIARRLAHCGIAWQDGGAAIMSDLALLAIGRNPDVRRADNLPAAEAALDRVRPYVRYIDSSSRFRSDLASGEVCIAIGASGEIVEARDLAARNGSGIELRYVLPAEGAPMWVDLLVIPVDAPHVEAAYRFLDFMLEPAVIAEVTNSAKFANANVAADPLVDPAVRRDPDIYPPPAVRPRLHLLPGESNEYTRLRTRMWSRVRANQSPD
jgi:putrescine transport system substrate-binding protein